MNLSQIIIYHSIDELSSALKERPKLNVLDEYGYTPLIQTAIVDDLAKAKLLLQAGAQVDFPDITGRTALFWAADNGNYEFCKLCLDFKANPNRANNGGQAVLISPIIKGYTKIKELLMKSGAKLTFAQDFLNAKILGHIFELEGRIDIINPHNQFIEIELEGFYLNFTVNYITSLLLDFKNSFTGKAFKNKFFYLDLLLQGLISAAKLLTKQDYLVDLQQFQGEINQCLNQELLILPIAYEGHAISFIRYHQYWVRIDRGVFGKKKGSAIIYQQGNKVNNLFYQNLLYKRQRAIYLNQELEKLLNLKVMKIIDLPLQQTGNCSWANVEGLIPLGLLLLRLEAEGWEKIEKLTQEVLILYRTWQLWNRERAVDFCLQSLEKAEISRQMTKVALLIALMFQSLKVESDKRIIDKILRVINKEKYKAIFGCYVKTFFRCYDHPLWQNFQKILDRAGLEEDELLRT